MIVFRLTWHCRLHPWLGPTHRAHVIILHTFIGAPDQVLSVQTRKISPPHVWLFWKTQVGEGDH